MLGRKRVNEALALMGEMFPNAHGELEWETPFQLLVAVILSAQRCVCERLVYTKIKQRTSSRLLELF